MTFSNKEQEIIKWASENGKSRTETEQALVRFRTTGSPVDPNKPEEKEAPLSERLSGVIQEAGEETSDILAAEGQFADQSRIRRTAGATARTVRAVPEFATEFLPKEIRGGIEKVGEFIGSGFKKLTDFLGSTELAQRFVTEHPKATKVIEEVAGTIAPAGEIAGTILGVEGALATPKVVGKVKTTGQNILSKTTKKTTETIPKLKGVISKQLTPEEKVLEMISPKITAKETRRIIDEARVVRGAKGGIKEKLFGSRADIITQTKQVEQARNTIMKRIDGADKLDDFTLNNKLKTEIKTISEEIKEPMKEVHITPQQTTQIKTTWDKLKTVQSKRDDFIAFNGKSTQKNFEAYLDSVKKSVKDETGKFRTKNMNDVWDIRKNYDNSIPDNVKQATTQSPARLQFRKEMWLENRAILNDTINDMANGLGDFSKGAFSDMTDLYTARQNIATKSKIITEGEKGILEKNIVKWGLTVGGSALLGSLAF